MPARLTTFCIDAQSNGTTVPVADGLVARTCALKKRWIRTRHLSIASSGLTAALITVLLVLNSVGKDSMQDSPMPRNETICIEGTCLKMCKLIPFCAILSNASKHVYLFNYELLYLKDVLWRPQMPSCVGRDCFINVKSTGCHYNHMFAGVSICFDERMILSTVGVFDVYSNNNCG